jgi:Na+-driven multidrug efflux pump
VQDFTEGNIGKQVINFGTPIMFGNLLMSVYGIINMTISSVALYYLGSQNHSSEIDYAQTYFNREIT